MEKGKVRELSLMYAALLALVALPAIPAGAAGDPDAVLGIWETAGDDRGHIEIYREDGKVHGRVIRLLEPNFPADDETHPGQPKVDRENPDPAQRNQSIIGLTIAKGFHFDDERWEGGTIYDPRNGDTYKCWMRLRDDGRLEVHGYIGFSWLGRSDVWARIP
jgi:uncharacterized protein (DUF2147 family)